MLKPSRFLSGLYSLLRHCRLALIGLASLVLLTGCDNPLSLLTGSGPNIAANTQAGQTNSQTIGQSNRNAPQVSLKPKSRVDTVDQSNRSNKVEADSVEAVVVNELPAWLVGVFVMLLIMWSYLLWKLPSPDQIWKNKEKDPT